MYSLRIQNIMENDLEGEIIYSIFTYYITSVKIFLDKHYNLETTHSIVFTVRDKKKIILKYDSKNIKKINKIISVFTSDS